MNASERLCAEWLGSPVLLSYLVQLDHQPFQSLLEGVPLWEADWRGLVGLDQGSGGYLVQRKRARERSSLVHSASIGL